MRARHDGVCAECHRRYRKGSEVENRRTGFSDRWVHAVCPPVYKPVDLTPKAPKPRKVKTHGLTRNRKRNGADVGGLYRLATGDSRYSPAELAQQRRTRQLKQADPERQAEIQREAQRMLGGRLKRDGAE